MIVLKQVVNDNGGTKQVSDFPLFVNNTQVTSGSSTAFAVGSYQVSETQATGYTATFSGDCNVNGMVIVVPNQTKTCVITNNDNQTNTQTGSLKVIKHVVNTNSNGARVASDFLIHVKKDGAEITGSPRMGTEAGRTYTVAPGTYMVSENIFPLGYRAVFSGDCDRFGRVKVDAGQAATCTITNTQR